MLIGWTAPEGVQQANIESYHVYVDGVLKTTVKATERTRALVEGVDANRVSKLCYLKTKYLTNLMNALDNVNKNLTNKVDIY